MESVALADALNGPVDELVLRAREGDFTAFEELYHRNVHRIYAICLRMTADVARAEDLVQEAFVRAWQRLGTIEDAGGFAVWLRRLTINVVLSDRRARSRRPNAGSPLEDGPAEGSWNEPARGMDLERAVAGLPTRARQVFVLHDIEGYRHQEIATLLGVTVGTSKAQLHRARKLLREAL